MTRAAKLPTTETTRRSSRSLVKTEKKEETHDSPRSSSASSAATPIRIKKEESDGAAGGVDQFGLSPYERKRLETIARNQQVLASLEIPVIPAAATAKSSRSAVAARRPKRERSPPPRRASLRLQGKTFDGIDLPVAAMIEASRPPEPSRIYADVPFVEETDDTELVQMEVEMLSSMREHSTALLFSRDSAGAAKKRSGAAAAAAASSSSSSSSQYCAPLPSSYAQDLADTAIVDSFSKLKVRRENDVFTVTSRIFSLAFHPTRDKVFCSAGQKSGHILFVDHRGGIPGEIQPNPLEYKVHRGPVNAMEWDVTDPCRMYTSGFDGMVKVFDVNKAVFTQVWAEETEDIAVQNIAQWADGNICVGFEDGDCAVLDPRAGAIVSTKKNPHLRRCNVSTCVASPNLFVTYSVDTFARVWDIRMFKSEKPIFETEHKRSVNAAHLDPHTGDKLLTNSLDDSIRVSIVSSGASRSLKHPSNTGRWLTKLKCIWDPRYTNIFLMGIMDHPRRVEVFRAGEKGEVAKLMRMTSDNFTTVSSIHAVHPFRNVIAAGAAGKVYLWH